MDYFYEHESELFTFYRVPKVLFTEKPFKNMNCEAKLLYGLLLDKMGLSRKSGWFDRAPVDPRRDPRTEKTGRKQWNGEYLRVIESRVGNPRRFPPYTLDPQ